ncbi:hypothetical protein D9M71_385730 [compost metagenome]
MIVASATVVCATGSSAVFIPCLPMCAAALARNSLIAPCKAPMADEDTARVNTWAKGMA